MDAFGIEIRDDSLALAHLKTSLFGLSFKGCEVFGGETLAERLRGVKDYISRNSGKNSVCVALPREAAVSGTIKVPAPDRSALKNMLAFEMDRHLPFSPGEAYWDFDVISGGHKAFTVLFAAVRRDTLDGIMDEFRRAGVEPTSAVFWQASVGNALSYVKESGKEGLVAVAGFGPGRVALDIFSGSNPVYSKSVGAGHLNDEHRAGALVSMLEAFAEFEKHPEKKFEGRVVIPDNAGTWFKDLSSQLGVPVAPFRMSGLGNVPSSSVAAVGAALAAAGKGSVNIDLLQSNKGKPAGSALKRVIALSTATAGLLFLTGAAYIVKDRIMLDRLDSMLEEARAARGKVEGVADSLSTSSGRLKTLEEIKGSFSPGALEVLRELALTLPQGTWLTDFEYREGSVLIEGFSDRASTQILRMEGSGLIKDAEFTGPVTAARGKDHFKIRFRAAYSGGMKKEAKAAE